MRERRISSHKIGIVATTRRLPSDSGAFADWLTSSSSSGRAAEEYLSLGFNAGPTAGTATGPTTGGGGGGGGMWSSTARQINYGLPSEMGMVGLRDVFVVAPASSFHHHHNNHHEPIISDPHAAAASLGVGVIPLLTATPANIGVDEDGLNNNRSRNSGIQLWQQNQQSQHSNFLQSGGGSGGGIGGPSSTSVATCQDCGNQAKKDCTNRRCRTCCKSRGFDCATHVKSTWIPAVRRRERHLMGSTATAAAAGSSGSTSGAKKARLISSQTTTTSHTSASNTPSRSFDTSSTSHQDASFKEGLPGQVRVPAVFKCVRVTAVDDGDDEYAYQGLVKIGGHVFKGFLYDHGVEEREGFPNISELHLGGGGGGRNGASLSAPILDTADVYGGSGGGLLGVSSYGNQIN